MSRRAPLTLLFLVFGTSLILFLTLEAESSVLEDPKPNRLIHEKSPYLLQHAYNPVDWHPWGEEAFRVAREHGKPIFLSIGYSTCHWCHVMERESFANPEIAAVLNKHFVSIKVDREERPDIDQIYMAFVQATTGGGGWPMSVFMTADRKPFFGGTYFPPEPSGNLPGFKPLLEKVAEEWERNRSRIVDAADKLTEVLERMARPPADPDLELDRKILDSAYDWYRQAYDPEQGGFGNAPKFPRPVNFNFLLRQHHRSSDPKALEMTTHSLRGMARGGMRDHLGGGFHRYSTDDRWFLPHFEKMLYDQAQLAVAYLEAYQIGKDREFREIAVSVLEYVLRDMTDTGGGFYSAEDADSVPPRGTSVPARDSSSPDSHAPEKAEGAFYVWSHREIAAILGPEARVFARFYGVKEEGNVERDPFEEFGGKNVLYQSTDVQSLASDLGKTEAEIRRSLESARKKLFQVREKRPRPLRDDKILTAWNGLMISAFAKAHQVMGEEKYLQAARKAAGFVADRLYDAEKKVLYRRYRGGSAAIPGFLGDYAFFVQGLLDLYESSLESRWLALSLDLTERMLELFGDQESGGFFNTTSADRSLLVRMREDYDGAEPAPGSIAVLNLLRLAEMTNSQTWRTTANRALRSYSERLVGAPQAMPQLLVALDFHLEKPRQILIAGESGAPDTQRILQKVHSRFLPRKVLLLADGGPLQERIAGQLEILANLRRIDGKATAYICRDYVCDLPTNDPEVVGRLLER